MRVGNILTDTHINTSMLLRHPLVVAIIMGLLGLTCWKAVAEWRLTATEMTLQSHSDRPYHDNAGGRIVRLETQFEHISDKLSYIQRLLEQSRAASNSQE